MSIYTPQIFARNSMSSLGNEQVDYARGSYPSSRSSLAETADPYVVISKAERKGQTPFKPVAYSDKYHFRLRFYDYKKPTPIYGESIQTASEVKYEIYLPLPSFLSDKASINYSGSELGVLGDLTNIAASNAGDVDSGTVNVAAAISSAVGSGVGSAFNRLALDITPRAASSIPGVGRFVDTEAVGTLLQQLIGATVNPNETQALQGPELRTWAFRWLFIPHNEEESRNIQILIRELKARSLPYIAKASGSNDIYTGLLGYPQICLINMYPWDSAGEPYNKYFEWTENSIVKIKRTVISEVNVSYNSQGTPAFFRGTNNPVSIELALAFKEIEYFLAEDEVGTNYTPQNVNFTPANVPGNIAEGLGRSIGNTLTSTSDFTVFGLQRP